MTAAAVQVWQRVDVSFRDEVGALSTYKLCNREIPGDQAYFPLIRAITGIGQRMGDVLPLSVSGSISIDCSPNSFGYERRFCDLLERLSPIDQEIVIYIAHTSNTDDDPTGDWVQVFKGTTRTARINPKGESLEIAVDSARLPKKYMNRIIDNVIFTRCPTGSVGKAAPLVFGNSIEVPGLLFDNLSTAPAWGYATNFNQQFTVGGVQQYYAQDYSGQFVAVASAASTSTKLFGNTPSGSTSGTVISPKIEYAQKFAAGNGGVATTCTLEWYNVTGAAHAAEEIIINVYVANGNTISGYFGDVLPGTLLGTARFNPSATGAGSKSSQASFDRPIVIKSGGDYYFGVTRRSASPTDTSIAFSRDAFPTSQNWYEKNLDGATSSAQENGWSTSTVTTGKIFLELFGVVFADNNAPSGTLDSQGFHIAYVVGSHRSAASGQANPDISTLNMLFSINGLRDDSSGNITGSANAVIKSAYYIAKVLDYTWNGSSWVAGTFDTGKFSGARTQIDQNQSATTTRWTQGRTEGRQTWESVMRAICLNSGSRLALTNSTSAGKNYGIWGWGNTITASATLTDEDSEIITIEYRGTETIVNHARVYFNNKLKEADITKISAEGNFSQFASFLDWYNGSNLLATSLAANSAATFGDRPNRDEAFPWIADTTSAESMAQFMLGVFAFPHVFVELECPLWKYRTLEIMDVINIIHPALPAYFGTSPAAKLPTYDGQEVDIIQGHYWKRAQPYRAQIEARQIDFNVDGYPLLRLTARLLTNTGDPT